MHACEIMLPHNALLEECSGLHQVYKHLVYLTEWSHFERKSNYCG